MKERNKKIIRLVLVGAVSMFFVALAFSGTAPKPKPTYYLNIPPAAFTGMNEGSNEASYLQEGWGIYVNTPSTWVDLTSPVYLPQGATVTGLQILLYDNDNSYDTEFTVSLYSSNIYSKTFSALATIWTSTTGSIDHILSFNDTSINDATIDNVNNFYFISLVYNPHYYSGYEYFYGCRIAYTL